MAAHERVYAADFQGAARVIKKREQKQTSIPATVLLSEGNALNRFPFFDDFALSRCPVSVKWEHGNGRLHAENNCRVVGKVDVGAVVVSGDINLNALDDLAFGLWKFRRSCALLWRLVSLLFSHDAPRLRCGQGRVHAVNMGAARL